LLLAVGFFGSYARGDWGVGSDLDLIVIVGQASDQPEKRTLHWDTSDLPVPTDMFIYTVDEWRDLTRGNRRFARTIRMEAKWVYRRDGFEVFFDADRDGGSSAPTGTRG
jgi:predicted nucleotidyltransferase